MLKELLLLVTLLALFADARPRPSKVCAVAICAIKSSTPFKCNPQVKDTVELSGETNIEPETEEDGDKYTSKDDNLESKSCSFYLRKKKTRIHLFLNRNDYQLLFAKEC